MIWIDIRSLVLSAVRGGLVPEKKTVNSALTRGFRPYLSLSSLLAAQRVCSVLAVSAVVVVAVVVAVAIIVVIAAVVVAVVCVVAVVAVVAAAVVVATDRAIAALFDPLVPPH